MATSGGRAAGGARRGPPTRPRLTGATVVLLVVAVLTLAGWGALVWVAIGFGRSARGGQTGDWLWLAVTSVGAVGCLFACLLLATMAVRRVGRAPHRSTPRH